MSLTLRAKYVHSLLWLMGKLPCCQLLRTSNGGGRGGGSWAGIGQPVCSKCSSQLLILIIALALLLLWIACGPVDFELGAFLEPAPLCNSNAILVRLGLWALLSIQACLLSIFQELHRVSDPLRAFLFSTTVTIVYTLTSIHIFFLL